MSESLTQIPTDQVPRYPVRHKGCPFCANDIGLPRRVNGIFLVGCEADDCPANPQVSGYTMVEAFAKWDARI